MAKDKAKKPEAGKQKGGIKSSRWSAQTKENKKRGRASRENRLSKAAERRSKGATVTDPVTGKVKKSVLTRDNRLVQSRRVATKAAQRRNFKALTPKEKDAHRAAGRKQFSKA